MPDHRQAIKVYVTLEERRRLMEQARNCDLSVSAYLRQLGTRHELKSTLDAQAVLSLIKVNADQGRLGGLLKLWLTDRPGAGVAVFDVRRLLCEIEAAQGELRSLLKRLNDLGAFPNAKPGAIPVATRDRPLPGHAP